MDYIIARTAARPAMSRSPNLMSIDYPHIECKFHRDRRLIIGVATIVRHAAAHAGLGKQEQKSLAEATVKACDEGFRRRDSSTPDGSVLRMGVSTFSDRVEVNLEFPEEVAPAAQLSPESRGEHPGVKLVQYREVLKSKSVR
jgi:hypothetical protein